MATQTSTPASVAAALARLGSADAVAAALEAADVPPEILTAIEVASIAAAESANKRRPFADDEQSAIEAAVDTIDDGWDDEEEAAEGSDGVVMYSHGGGGGGDGAAAGHDADPPAPPPAAVPSCDAGAGGCGKAFTHRLPGQPANGLPCSLCSRITCGCPFPRDEQHGQVGDPRYGGNPQLECSNCCAHTCNECAFICHGKDPHNEGGACGFIACRSCNTGDYEPNWCGECREFGTERGDY